MNYEDDNILKKLERVSEEECVGMKRMPLDILIGHCALVFDKVGVPHTNPIPEDYFDAVIYGLFDYFYGGFEPEFDTEEEYDKYEAAIAELKKSEYMYEDYYVDSYGERRPVKPFSPYMDKTIPFLANREKYN